MLGGVEENGHLRVSCNYLYYTSIPGMRSLDCVPFTAVMPTLSSLEGLICACTICLSYFICFQCHFNYGQRYLAVLVMIILLSGDLELNPGPPGEKWHGSIAGSKVDVTIDY